jgi:hypothetical protein
MNGQAFRRSTVPVKSMRVRPLKHHDICARRATHDGARHKQYRCLDTMTSAVRHLSIFLVKNRRTVMSPLIRNFLATQRTTTETAPCCTHGISRLRRVDPISMLDAPRRSSRRNNGKGRDKFEVGDLVKVSDQEGFCAGRRLEKLSSFSMSRMVLLDFRSFGMVVSIRVAW